MPFLAVEGDCDGDSSEPVMRHANTDSHAQKSTCNTNWQH